ncbi:MAG: hypothetical protein AUJ48_03255 [Deltaproteobacteria bacterium CG1_02_45_11]|nr:MAG: hypothetical protein AUJ48_03255 [Deltaproteobacteria bacterium CG1_02_45_11]
MKIDFAPFFKKYEELSGAADAVFERVKKEHSNCVKCKLKCSDCCHALFDLTLIEALYINHYFNKKFGGKERDILIDKSNQADRNVYKIKKKAFKALETGKDENKILKELAQERVRCPLLNEQEMCELYEYRPITCRLYGIPTAIGGVGHTCGMSGFVRGRPYPTVNLDMIQTNLYKISDELVRTIKSKYVKMADLLVPVSMAICTVYDEEYLGISDGKKADAKAIKKKEEND